MKTATLISSKIKGKKIKLKAFWKHTYILCHFAYLYKTKTSHDINGKWLGLVFWTWQYTAALAVYYRYTIYNTAWLVFCSEFPGILFFI